MKPRLPILSLNSSNPFQISRRCLQHSSPRANAEPAATQFPADVPNPRWLSEMKARLGKCIMFGGMDTAAIEHASGALKMLAREWRELVAGREGFLTARTRAGLLRHKVVWGEQDCMSHVNNVTYVRWAESARINWARNYAVHMDPGHKREWSDLWTPKGDGLILRSMRTDYKFPMTWPDHISVFHKLRTLPKSTDSHFILDVLILSELHQRPAARCVEDIVVYDYKKGEKVPIRPFMMEAFQKTFQEQEKEQKRIARRIIDVEKAVRRVEQQTWDKPGAIEEMGPSRRGGVSIDGGR